MAFFSRKRTHRWIDRGVAEDVGALVRQSGLALQLHAAKVAEFRRTSGLGLFAPFLSVLVHVTLLGFVMGEVFQEPVSTFLPFFAVSFCVWQAITLFLSEAVYVNERAHGYLAFTRLSGFIVHMINVLDLSLNLLLKMMAAGIVIAFSNFSVLVQANYLALLAGWAVLVFAAAAWSLPISYFFDRYRIFRGFLPQIIFAIYLVSPILWEPRRIGSHRWVIDVNPFFHLIELIRAPVLQGVFPLMSCLVSAFICVSGLVLTIFLYRKNRELVVFRWIA